MQYNRIFAIGDVHGHYDELMLLYNQLLVKAKLNPKKDRLIFIGDMIDGGTQTKQVLEKCLQWETKYPHWIFLLGNHEDLMIDALGNQQKYQSWDLWWKQGGKATTYSYYPRKASVYEKALMQPENYIPPQHINWLKTRPLWHEEKDYFFVHAGLVPDITIKQHTNGNNIKLWGEMLWIRDQFLDSDYDWGKKIVFGHTPFRKPKIEKNKIAIDTGFRFNGHLSAVELPAEKIYMQQNISSPSW